MRRKYFDGRVEMFERLQELRHEFRRDRKYAPAVGVIDTVLLDTRALKLNK
jgi:hypothetical protein